MKTNVAYMKDPCTETNPLNIMMGISHRQALPEARPPLHAWLAQHPAQA